MSTKTVKTAIWVDPMGSMFESPEEQIAFQTKTFEEELGVKLDVHTPQNFGQIEVGTDLVLFDFGGMMMGNSLAEDNSRRLVRWAEDNPNSLVVVISDFTFDRAFRYEIANHLFDGDEINVPASWQKPDGERHKTPVHNITVEHWGENFIPDWFRKAIGAKPWDGKDAVVERELENVEVLEQPDGIDDECARGTLPSHKFFEPTKTFVSVMGKKFGKRLIYDVGAGMGHVANALSKSKKFKNVVALDMNARIGAEFKIKMVDATSYGFSPLGVVMFCRPCHGLFVNDAIDNALECGVKDIVYVGLEKNVSDDLGDYFSEARQLKTRKIGSEEEKIWIIRRD